MGLTDTEKEEVGGGVGGSVLLIIIGVVIVLYCWRRARTGYVSVRNTLDEEERADGRNDSKGNFVEDIVADIDSLFDFSKAGEKKSCEEEESLTIELENLSLLEDFNHHRKSSANSTDSPRGEYLKRRRSSRDDDETVISLQVCDDEEK